MPGRNGPPDAFIGCGEMLLQIDTCNHVETPDGSPLQKGIAVVRFPDLASQRAGSSHARGRN
jgi:hypothetical protein